LNKLEKSLKSPPAKSGKPKEQDPVNEAFIWRVRLSTTPKPNQHIDRSRVSFLVRKPELARREEMDQLVDLLHQGLHLYLDKRSSDEMRKMDVAGKMPAVQGGDSEQVMEMTSNRRSDEGLRFLGAEKRPEVQGGDSKEEMEIASNMRSCEGLQLDAAGQRPELQAPDQMRCDGLQLLRILMQNMQPGDQKERLAKLLKYEEENLPQKQENQRQKQKVLQCLMHSVQQSDEKEMLAKLLKHAFESQPQKQENKQHKQNKKHHRKSRMALRKIALDKVKKSNLQKAHREDKAAAAYLAACAMERESEPESESRSDWHAYQARLRRDRWNKSFAAKGHYGTYETISKSLGS
jgi:hypothetical protein